MGNIEFPISLRPIIEEKHDNLKGSRFNIPRGANPSTIIFRLNKRASSSINSLSFTKRRKPCLKT